MFFFSPPFTVLGLQRGKLWKKTTAQNDLPLLDLTFLFKNENTIIAVMAMYGKNTMRKRWKEAKESKRNCGSRIAGRTTVTTVPQRNHAHTPSICMDTRFAFNPTHVGFMYDM